MTDLLGAHVPTAGGLHNAPAHGHDIGATAIQVFTRSQRQWAARPLEHEEAASFRAALAASGVRSVMSHASYLINLASPDPALSERGREAFRVEMTRCHALGIPLLVFHPGAHLGAGEDEGVRAVARSLDVVLTACRGARVTPAIELTAGQGSCVGHRFEHLAEMLARVKSPDRVAVCLDTCHLYAAGYDIATPRGYEKTLAEFDRVVGLDKLRAIHLNDSRKPLGSRVDRHAPIGEGFLGLRTFRRLLADPRLRDVPKVLETPGGLEAWRRELALLRGLRPRARRPA
ncbi:MAG TPA: deoxyribonuclease IV [Vicinamibacteria bacterium]|nr:deoxyribonuclease IV [Vicinamibacteria bacterium]